MKRLYSAGVAARAILGSRLTTHNPSPAAAFLLKLGPKRRAAVERLIRRRTGKRSFFRGNPLPAVAGVLGGLPSLGRRTDPKKMKERAAKLQIVANRAMQGDEAALEQLQAVSQGLAWPGGWAELRALAAQYLALASEKQEKRAGERRAAAEAATAREARYLGAGADVASSLFGALGRSGRSLPRRRKKRRRRTAYY